jgi:hypothetical protein
VLRRTSSGEHPSRGLIVEDRRALELRRPDAGVDLGCVDPDVAEQCAHFFEIVPLLEYLDRHAVPQVVRLELGAVDIGLGFGA